MPEISFQLLPRLFGEFIHAPNKLFLTERTRLWCVNSGLDRVVDPKDIDASTSQCVFDQGHLFFATNLQSQKSSCLVIDTFDYSLNTMDLPYCEAWTVGSRKVGLREVELGKKEVFVYENDKVIKRAVFEVVTRFICGDDYVIFREQKHNVVCLNHDLSERWSRKFDVKKMKDRGPYVFYGAVVVTSISSDGMLEISCLNIKDGSQIWKYTCPEKGSPFRLQTSEKFILFTLGSVVFVLSTETGNEITRIDTDLNSGRNLAFHFNEYICCFSDSDNRIEIYSADDFTLLQSIDLPEEYSVSSISGNPVVFEDKLYVRIIARKDALFEAWNGYFELSIDENEGVVIHSEMDKIKYQRNENKNNESYYSLNIDAERLDDVVRLGEVGAREIASLYSTGGTLADNTATLDKQFNGGIVLSSKLSADLKSKMQEEVDYINLEIKGNGYRTLSGNDVKILLG